MVDAVVGAEVEVEIGLDVVLCTIQYDVVILNLHLSFPLQRHFSISSPPQQQPNLTA